MKLTHKQKKYLRKNINKQSVEKIANYLRVPEEEIKRYLEKVWDKKKYEDFFAKDKVKNTAVFFKKTSFRKWFSKNLGQILILATLVIVAYINSINNRFVSDDINGIVNNATLNNFKVIFTNPFASFHVFIYYFINLLFGHSAAAFRLVSIFFHLSNVILLYFLISITLGSRVGFITALLFAVHPLLSESVVWISAGYGVYATFWILISFIGYIFFTKYKSISWYWAAVFCYLLALESSEKVIIFPIVLFFYQIWRRNVKKYWLKLIPFFTLSFIWGGYLLGALGRRTASLQKNFYQQALPIKTPWQFMVTTFRQTVIAVSSYLKLIVWPQNLTLYHSEMYFSKSTYMAMIILFLLYLGAIIYTFFRHKKIFFWLSFFIIALSPTLTPYGVSWIVAERYAYMASIGIFVIIGLGFAKLSKIGAWKDITWIVLGLIIIAFLGRTIVRNGDWKNQDTLWLAAAKTSPSSSQNHNNLGDYYSRHGQFKKATEEFKKAIRLNPRYADAYHNLANTYQQMGQIDQAIKNYKRAIKFNGNLWQSYENLAAIYFNQKKFSLAEKNLQETIKIKPKNANLLVNLGVVYLKLNKPQQAREAFQKALKLDPNNQRARQALSGN